MVSYDILVAHTSHLTEIICACSGQLFAVTDTWNHITVYNPGKSCDQDCEASKTIWIEEVFVPLLQA